MKIGPASAETVAKFLDRVPRGCVAYSATENGKTYAIWGYFHTSGGRFIFSDISEDGRKHKLLLFKTAKEFMQAQKTMLPIFAYCDKNIEGSQRFLERLGFVKIAKDKFQWLPQAI